MKKILTVSIAAYNVETYLKKTLDSLVKKDLMDLIDVLIINDGSKDNTVSVASEYVEKYPNTFRLIDKENGGHGSTINKAIECADGKYICLLDGDDWVDTEQFYMYVKELKNLDVDLIVNGFNTVDEKNGDVVKHTFENVEYRKMYSFDTLPETETMGLSAITYRTDILKKNNIKIDEKCFYVDMEYIVYPVPYVNNIIFLPYIIYQYRVNQGTQSVSRASLLAHVDNHAKVSYELLKFYGEYSKSMLFNENKQKYFQKVISDMMSNHYSVLLLQKASKKNKKEIDNFDNYLWQNAEKIYINLNSKIWIKIIRKKSYFLYWIASMLIKCKIR